MPKRTAIATSWLTCSVLACAAATATSVEPGVDTHQKPGDDFFAYANGDWLAVTEIPAESPRWNARSEINARTREQVATLVDEAASAPRGSDARKVADFRAAYADAAAIESRGLAPLADLFDRIDAVRDKAALARLLGARIQADVDPLNRGIYDSA